jgi:glucokinase
MRKKADYAILSSMKYHIAVDIGGTQMRAASYHDQQDKPHKIRRIPTRDPSGEILDRLYELIASVYPDEGNVEGLAVAAPGPLDPFQGIIFEAPNIPEWVDLPLRARLQSRFDTHVEIGNDANLAALGEWRFGAGRGHHHIVYLTVSTGIGGGVIINDRMLLGVNGLAGELGHVTVLPDGPICSCGQPGHLEAVASGPAIAKWVQAELQKGAESSLKPCGAPTAIQIAQAAAQGDELARKAIDKACYYIGICLANYLHIFNPSIIIIGGGVSRSGALILEPIRIAMEKHAMVPHYLENLSFSISALGDDAGLMGALALARRSSQEAEIKTVTAL